MSRRKSPRSRSRFAADRRARRWRTSRSTRSSRDRSTPASPQRQPVSQRSCPIVVVRRAPPPAYAEAYEEPQPAYPNRTHSRSYSSSVVTVNGRVVSSSSVTMVNGRVVSRSGSPPTPVDDDDEW